MSPAVPQATVVPRHGEGHVNPSVAEGVAISQDQASGSGLQIQAAGSHQMGSSVQLVSTEQSPTAGQASLAAMSLEDGHVYAVRADVEVQQNTSSLTVVRWISRLNEFLTTQGQSVFGSVGFNTTPTQGPRHSRAMPPALTPASTPPRATHTAAAVRPGSTQGSPLVFSPPLTKANSSLMSLHFSRERLGSR